MTRRDRPLPCRTAALLLIALFALAGSQGRPALAAPLVADLSNHLIAITTGFAGTDVLMFGATDGPGDIIVTVRGPLTDVSVRRKERVAGIWVNRDSLTFGLVPSFYAVASSRPIEELLAPEMLERQQVGENNLALIRPDAKPTKVEEFRQALLRVKEEQGLYSPAVGKISFLGNQLFRTELRFPSNVPIGSYLIEVMLIRDGRLVSAQTTPLVISKSGVDAEIYQFAHAQSLAYGVSAVLVALLLGWFAYLIFRKI
jgi:uncharacterized protein (TIGR02186 family)